MQINIVELVYQAQNGDRGACSKLYQLTFKSSYYLALKITGNESIAAQSVEASYKKAFSSIASIKNPESFEAWIKHITAVKSIELLKQNNQLVFGRQASAYSQKIGDDTEFLPKGLEKSANAGKAINKIVDSLPACQRVVTVLHYYNEMPVTHIAKMLDCPEETVVSELYSVREQFKKCVDRMINRETVLCPSENKPLLALILQSSGEQQKVDETLLRTIFASASAGMFVETAKEQTVFTVSSEHQNNRVKPSEKNNHSVIFKKIKGMSDKHKIIAAVCAVMAVLIVAGAVFIPEISQNSEKDSTNKIDAEMLKSIEPYEKDYENLLTFYAESFKEDDDVFDGGFNFVYFNDNEIPDLTIDYKCYYNDQKDYYYTSFVCLDASEEVYEINLLNTWFGSNGYYVVSDIERQADEQSEAYYKYKYESEKKPEVFAGGLRYDKVLEDEDTSKEYWSYMADSEGNIQELTSRDEYNQKKDILLEGFNRILSSYDIFDFADSGKSLTKYLKKAKTFSVILDEDSKETTTQATTSIHTTNGKTVIESDLEATYQDWEALKEDLSTILIFCSEYNNKSDDAYEMVLSEYCTTMIYSLYFETSPEYAYGNDPLGYFEDTEYCIFNVEDVDWIITNVFNQTPNHKLKTSERYYYEGKYYAAFYPGSCPFVEVNILGNAKHSDGGYTVILNKTSFEGEGYGAEGESGYTHNLNIRAELKQINGKKVWSYYYIITKETQEITKAETTTETKVDNWKTAYNKYLKNVYDDCDPNEFEFTDQMSFGFAYINDDNIPELLVAEGTAQASMVRVVTYVNGKVVEVGEYGSVGAFEYVEKGSLIASSRYGHGNHSGTLYSMSDDGSAKELFSFFSTLPSEDGNYSCEVNDQKVSYDEYEKQFDENWPDSSMLTSSNTSYAFTYEDFDKYCS